MCVPGTDRQCQALGRSPVDQPIGPGAEPLELEEVATSTVFACALGAELAGLDCGDESVVRDAVELLRPSGC